jgi:acyl-coenzyme A thioesterase PaaI-like protein
MSRQHEEKPAGESFASRLARWKFNLFPAYRGTGARVDYIAPDWREVRVRLPLSWRTRNLVGTIFGGSLYASIDPIYMVMLIRNLGSEYVVWDKSATIRFRKPGRSTLYARFVLTAQELDAIRAELSDRESIDRVYRVNLIDAAGTVHATAEKTIYIRHKNAEISS